MPVAKQSVSLSPSVVAEIQARGDNFSGTIDEQLDRWFEALKRARAEIRDQFSAGECALILDSTNGTMFQAFSIMFLYANIEDSISMEHLDQKWQVDGLELLKKLDNLTYVQLAAIIDGSERWWNRVGYGGEQPAHDELLK